MAEASRVQAGWRRELLRVVLRATAGLGAIIYVPSVVLALQHGLVSVFVVDTVALAAVIALWWFDDLPMRARAFGACSIFYLVGVGLLLTVGAVSQIYLLGFSVFTTLLAGVRWRIASVVLNALTLGLVLALTDGVAQMQIADLAQRSGQWGVVVANFTFINAGLVLSVGMVLDTLEREHRALAAANEALREHRALLGIAGRTALLGGWRYDLAQRQLTWSDELRDLLGVPAGTSPDLDALIGLCHESARSQLRAAIDRCAHDGTPFDLCVDAVSMSGQPRSLRCLGVVDRSATGDIVNVHGSIQDQTTQRDAERRHERLEAQLRQRQKLEAIGALAGGIAHDFNNLLTVILSYSASLVEELPRADPMRDDLLEVQRAAERAAALTRQLLAFGRKQLLQPVTVDLNVAIDELQKLLTRLLREDITLTVLHAPHACPVSVDVGQLEQVVVNLVVNARDAMPDGGKLTIELAPVTADEAYVAAHPGSSLGHFGMLTVTDTGVGMTKETRERIFEPFFTTKGPGQGTGLGLATVYGIVQQSGGHLWVYSEPGRGTSFRVLFPAAGAGQPSPETPTAARATRRGSETVLVVEDEAQVRDVVCTALRRLGYTVLSAQNGGEALMISEQFTATIHLLVTDVVMPMMSGRQVAERLRQTRPHLAVLFSSGYTGNTITHHGMLEGGVAFVAKPFTADTLARRVREVLDAPRSSAPPALR